MNWIKKAWAGIPLNPKTVREFGFILAGFLLLFPLLANLIGMLLARRDFHYWLGWPLLSTIALVVNLFSPLAMTLIYQVAMFVAHGISWVMMRLMLGILFYLVLSPVSITMRILGNDLIDQKIDRQTASYWKKRPAKAPREQYERLF